MQVSRRGGFTIIEVALAIAIGLVMMTGVIGVYNSVRQTTNMSNARSMVGTIQTNIAMDKFRNGTPPPVGPTPNGTGSAVGIGINLDSNSVPYWAGNTATALPADPITGLNQLLTYNSALSPVPLVAGDPTDRWDNPIFTSPGATASVGGLYGKGGWLYSPTTGAFRINLTNRDYPGDRPGGW